MQNRHFGSKIKIPKNMSKCIVEMIYSCSPQKTAAKNTKYSRNETLLKICHHAKAIAHANPHFGSKTKIAQNMSKFIVETI